jgi:multiple sugar transport system substrate-binding protein
MEVWMADMNKIKKATNIPGFVFSAQTFSLYENWFANFMDYMRNGPAEFTRLMNREAKMSDPAHIHIAKFLEDLTKSGNILPGSVTLGIDPADQAFAQGRAAYLLGGTFTYANLQAMGMNVDDIVSFRVPAYEGSEVPDATVTPFPLVTVNVNSKGEHVAESVDFVKFMTSTQGMTLYANNAFDIPSVSMEDMSDLNPAIRSMLSSLSTESNWWSENTAISGKVFSNAEWQVFAEGKQRILLGEATAMEVAKSFDEAAEIEKQRASK